MLSLGGVIGTGLFLSSGYTISQAGPAGTILAYLAGALIVYLVMLCLGELSVAMPVTGSFHMYASRFIGPGTGFTVAWLYWLTWAVALGSEFTGCRVINAALVPRYFSLDVERGIRRTDFRAQCCLSEIFRRIRILVFKH